MDKNEIIFFLIAIVAYLICAFMLNMPLFMHIIFAVLILVVAIITILAKFQTRYENELIINITTILLIISSIFYFISIFYEVFYKKILLTDSTWILLVIFLLIIVRWLFGKNKGE